MKFINYLFLFFLGLGITSSVAIFQDSPGYMDADYYYAGGVRLAQGFGFSEPFLWNFLDDPQGLPHPSHTYWMPLPSILVMLGMALSGAENFSGGKLLYLIIAGFIPVITSALAFSLTGKKRHALLAGILAAIPGFYLSYVGTTDAFGLYMVLGGLFLFLVGHQKRLGRELQALFLGLIAGLMHLTRADGALWLILALISVILIAYQSNSLSWPDRLAKYLGAFGLPVILCLIGYLLVLAPWMIRNLREFGVLMASSGIKSLWLTDYNQLYAYPSSILTFDRWLESGFGVILQARLVALWQNLQTTVVVQGEIFLTPLVLMGLWHYRRELRVQIGGLGWLITFVVMTFVFPFVGWRGGFFHSGSAFQPLFWSVAPVGLELFIGWGVRKRGWVQKQATVVFSAGVIFFSFLLATFAVRSRVIGPDINNPSWGESNRRYSQLEEGLRRAGADANEIVLVNNAPGYFVATGRSAISIPDGDLNTSLLVAERYGATIFIIENNHPPGLDRIYQLPADYAGIDYLTTIDEAHIFRIIE
jgi:hypothetical protein